MTLKLGDIAIGSFEDAARGAVGAVVIIDVFRAFTTAATALANGASRIVMVGNIETALDFRERGVGRFCIGERGGVKPEDFDYGNSPAELAGVRFDGETLIQTTSNGVRGILAAGQATLTYAGAFVTAGATARAILKIGMTPVTIVAMGEGEGTRADEDELCALYLRSKLLGREPDNRAVERAVRSLSRRTDGVSLSDDDVDCCLSIDKHGFAIGIAVEDGLTVAVALPSVRN